jgi:hypothetical protein
LRKCAKLPVSEAGNLRKPIVMKTQSEPAPKSTGSPGSTPPLADNAAAGRSRSTAWYSEGEGCVVRAENVEIVVTFLTRKGRRFRVQIEAPAGAEFEEAASREAQPSER